MKTNHKVLLAPLIWSMNDGYGRETYLPTTIGSMLTLQDDPESVGCDILFVNNASSHPETLKMLEEWASRDNCEVFNFEQNMGWHGGRNKAIEVFMQGDWERLILIDQDITIKEPTLINKVESLIKTDPELHAYMLLVLRADLQGTMLLASGTVVDVARELLGGCHIIDKKTVETIGGYATRPYFNMAWGWTDPLFARQLLYSGLLDYCGRKYVDPIRIQTDHTDPPILDLETKQVRETAVARYGMVFNQLESEIRDGKRSPYFPIEYYPARPM